MIPIIVKIEEDIRERIVYISHIYIDSAIQNYTPTPHDLDYPAKLYRTCCEGPPLLEYYAQRRNKDYKHSLPSPVTPSVYSVWYTPVQKVLHILSLLYTCVDVSSSFSSHH